MGKRNLQSLNNTLQPLWGQFCLGNHDGVLNCSTNEDNFQTVYQYQCYMSPYDLNLAWCLMYLANGTTIYQTHYL